jgi:bacteriocin-like protein
MEKIMSKTTMYDSKASEQVRESTDRELTEDELAHVSGGIIAILIGLLSSSASPPTVQSK